MLTETAQAPCRSCPEARGDRTHHSQTCGDAITANHKVLNEENESRLQRRCALREQDLYSYWIQSYPTENNTAQEAMKSLQKFVPPDHKPGIIQTDNSLFFSCGRVRLALRQVNPIPKRPKSQFVEKKEGTFALLVLSSLSEKWWGEPMESF